ncbi:MAG: LysR substrate-binding domain-containing protein [Pseudomonadota bacterium]
MAVTHKQLRAFHHVARQGGFSRAAVELGLTQPAISEQVRRLEMSRDVLLFERRGKAVILTQAGEALYAMTKRYFAVEAEIDAYFTDRADALSGRLRLVADAAQHVADRITRFRARYPGLRIEIQSGNTATVLARLRSYDADIGVIGAAPAEPDLLTQDLGSSPIIAFGLRKSLPSQPERIPLAALAKHPWVMREQGSETRALVERAAAERGLSPDIAIEVEGREALRAMVLSGGGIGFISAAEYSPDPALRAIDIADLTIAMPEALVCLAVRRDVRAIRTFMSGALEA